MWVCVSHTIRPRCPATQSSGRLLGQCWEGPPDSPLWKSPGRTGAWRGHPSGSPYERSSLHPFLTSQKHHRRLWLGTPAPLRCWWSLSPCLLGTDPHHLSWEEIPESKLVKCFGVCYSGKFVYLFIFTYCHSSMIWWSGWPDSAEWMTDWVNPHHRCHRCQKGQAPPSDLRTVG